MTDLLSMLLPKIKGHRLPGLELGNEWVYPAYQGLWILNIPPSVCRLFGIPELGHTVLAPEIMEPLGNGFRRVILILMDALSLHRLQGWMANGPGLVWNRLAEKGELAALTSVNPSTTSAALTSLWTGCSPRQHGIVGYEMWMKEYGVVANTILHAPMSFQGDVGSLSRAGFSPENYLGVSTLGAHLRQHGIHTHAFQHASIMNSGLSRMFFSDVVPQSFLSPSDLWVNVRQVLEARPAERMYTWVYWSEIDTFSHRYGPDDERTAGAFASFSQSFQQSFWDRLSPAARAGTLVILTADHGQIVTAQDDHYDLKYHPGLARRLHIQPTGENRQAFLYIRPGQSEAVREYIERTWQGQFTLAESSYLAECGLFGPGEAHPRLLDRLGDQTLLARGAAYLWWSEKENLLLGRHGGLSPQEMLVPFLAARMD